MSAIIHVVRDEAATIIMRESHIRQNLAVLLDNHVASSYLKRSLSTARPVS